MSSANVCNMDGCTDLFATKQLEVNGKYLNYVHGDINFWENGYSHDQPELNCEGFIAKLREAESDTGIPSGQVKALQVSIFDSLTRYDMFEKEAVEVLEGNEEKSRLTEKACGLLTCESYATLFGVNAMNQISEKINGIDANGFHSFQEYNKKHVEAYTRTYNWLGKHVFPQGSLIKQSTCIPLTGEMKQGYAAFMGVLDHYGSIFNGLNTIYRGMHHLLTKRIVQNGFRVLIKKIKDVVFAERERKAEEKAAKKAKREAKKAAAKAKAEAALKALKEKEEAELLKYQKMLKDIKAKEDALKQQLSSIETLALSEVEDNSVSDDESDINDSAGPDTKDGEQQNVAVNSSKVPTTVAMNDESKDGGDDVKNVAVVENTEADAVPTTTTTTKPLDERNNEEQATTGISYMVGECMQTETMGEICVVEITGVEPHVIKFKKIINGNRGNVEEILTVAEFEATYHFMDINRGEIYVHRECTPGEEHTYNKIVIDKVDGGLCSYNEINALGKRMPELKACSVVNFHKAFWWFDDGEDFRNKEKNAPKVKQILKKSSSANEKRDSFGKKALKKLKSVVSQVCAVALNSDDGKNSDKDDSDKDDSDKEGVDVEDDMDVENGEEFVNDTVLVEDVHTLPEMDMKGIELNASHRAVVKKRIHELLKDDTYDKSSMNEFFTEVEEGLEDFNYGDNESDWYAYVWNTVLLRKQVPETPSRKSKRARQKPPSYNPADEEIREQFMLEERKRKRGKKEKSSNKRQKKESKFCICCGDDCRQPQEALEVGPISIAELDGHRWRRGMKKGHCSVHCMNKHQYRNFLDKLVPYKNRECTYNDCNKSLTKEMFEKGTAMWIDDAYEVGIMEEEEDEERDPNYGVYCCLECLEDDEETFKKVRQFYCQGRTTQKWGKMLNLESGESGSEADSEEN